MAVEVGLKKLGSGFKKHLIQVIFKYELRFVAITWPNLCLWVVILCPELKPKKLTT